MKHYPSETVRRLLGTDLVTEPTRAALKKRLRATENFAPQFFNESEFRLLRAVCQRLIPHKEIDCAAYIDINFIQNRSDGWRYDTLPSDAETFRLGLKGINETAQIKFAARFIDLKEPQQDELLAEIQQGTLKEGIWKNLSAELFFKDLLTQVCAAYYSHPLAQEEIGYVGMADAPGWTRIKLNELDTREPRALPEQASD